METRRYSFKELLSSIIDNRGKTCPTADDGVPLIATNCIKNDALHAVYEKIRYVSEDTYKNWFRGHPRHEDLVFVCKGSPGRVAWVQDPVPYCIAQDMVAIRADRDKITPKYLFALLRAPQTQKLIENMHVGTLIPHFKKGDFQNLYFDIPTDMEFQKYVGELHFQLNEKVELNRQVNQTLEQMAQTLFKSWFVDFDPVVDNALAAGNPIPVELGHRVEVRKKAHAIPDFQPLPEHIRNLFPNEFEQSGEPTVGIGGWVPAGWSVKKLSDLLCVRYGKDHKKLDEGEYPVYGSGGLMRRVDKFLHEGESVLIPRKGTLSNIMYVNEAFWSVDTMFFTIPKMPNVAKFSFFLLKRLNFDSMNVGSAVPSMTTKVLNSLQIVYPTEFILAKFDEILGSYFSKERFNQDNNKQLERIRDTLLPKLISGAISINKEVE